eukprot:185446_1
MSWEEFFGGGPLTQYVQFFTDAGYDDFGFVVSLGPNDWEDMLDAVNAECEQAETSLKVGHRLQIVARLKREKANREDVEHQRQSELGIVEDEQQIASQKHFQRQAHVAAEGNVHIVCSRRRVRACALCHKCFAVMEVDVWKFIGLTI